MEEIRPQTLIICGEKDILFVPSESVQLFSRIQKSTVSIIQNSAHAIHLEQPEEFMKEVIIFLDQ
jgi:pimeloyl-ACP methyl ester carboxylesterase